MEDAAAIRPHVTSGYGISRPLHSVVRACVKDERVFRSHISLPNSLVLVGLPDCRVNGSRMHRLEAFASPAWV